MNYQQHLANSAAIRAEIQRFESVHPNIYSIYELLERVDEPLLQNQIREHVIAIEGSHVKLSLMQWTHGETVCRTLVNGCFPPQMLLQAVLRAPMPACAVAGELAFAAALEQLRTDTAAALAVPSDANLQHREGRQVLL
ncbi:hypothetical protein AOLI_G00000420 [Acnodon oligacanthus]